MERAIIRELEDPAQRFRTIDRADRYIAELDRGTALLVINGSAGMGKSVLAHQIVRRLQNRGDTVLHAPGPDGIEDAWALVSTHAAQAAARGRKVTLWIDNFDAVPPADPRTELIIAAIEKETALRVIVSGRIAGGLDSTDAALRVPMYAAGDSELSFTPADIVDIMALRGQDAASDRAAEVFELSGGWPRAVHRFLAVISRDGANADLASESVRFGDQLLAGVQQRQDPLENAAVILAMAMEYITPALLRAARRGVDDSDAVEEPLPSAADTEQMLLRLSGEFFRQGAPATPGAFMLHPFLRDIIWERRRRFARVEDVSRWARQVERAIGMRDESAIWLSVFAYFDAGDWSALNALLSECYSEDFTRPTPVVRRLITEIPESVTERLPILRFTVLLEEFAAPRGRDAFVIQGLTRLATIDLNAQSHVHGPRGLLAAGMRLCSARLTGQTAAEDMMLEVLPARMNELSTAEQARFHALLLTLCGQLAVSYWRRNEFAQVEKWSRQGINAVQSEITPGEVQLRSILALTAAWTGDIPRARKLLTRCERMNLSDVRWQRPTAVPYWIARAIVSLEDEDIEQARHALHMVSWRGRSHEFWPISVWVHAHLIEHDAGGIEALAWLRSQADLFDDTAEGTRHMALQHLHELHARLAWKYGRSQLVGDHGMRTGLMPVYRAMVEGDFAAAASSAARAAEEATAMALWRVRVQALLLVVVAEHALAREPESGTRARALALMELYELSTPRRVRPSWWDSPTAPALMRSVAAVGAPAPLGGAIFPGAPLKLTRAETRTLRAVAEHGTAVAAAAALYLSVHTVRGTLKAVYRKLGVRNRADAMRAAAESGLLAALPTSADRAPRDRPRTADASPAGETNARPG